MSLSMRGRLTHHPFNDIAETLRIGLPLAAAQLAQMAMGVTDTAFLGALGPDALAAGGLATTVEIVILIILQGVLAALSALVAQARGAGREAAIPGLYWTGMLLAVLLMLSALLFFQSAESLLLAIGEPPALAHAAGQFISLLQWSIPLGISQAANVRVGHAAGAGDRIAARRAGIAVIALGATAEIAFAAINLIAPSGVVRLFLDPATPAAAIAIVLLRVAAIFQIADGTQCVASGALRGLGDTRIPFALAAISYWGVGFPAAWILTLHTSLGPTGAWCGLAAGLIAAAALMTQRFRTRLAHPI